METIDCEHILDKYEQQYKENNNPPYDLIREELKSIITDDLEYTSDEELNDLEYFESNITGDMILSFRDDLVELLHKCIENWIINDDITPKYTVGYKFDKWEITSISYKKGYYILNNSKITNFEDLK
jgi:hypothetical protein